MVTDAFLLTVFLVSFEKMGRLSLALLATLTGGRVAHAYAYTAATSDAKLTPPRDDRERMPPAAASLSPHQVLMDASSSGSKLEALRARREALKVKQIALKVKREVEAQRASRDGLTARGVVPPVGADPPEDGARRRRAVSANASVLAPGGTTRLWDDTSGDDTPKMPELPWQHTVLKSGWSMRFVPQRRSPTEFLQHRDHSDPLSYNYFLGQFDVLYKVRPAAGLGSMGRARPGRAAGPLRTRVGEADSRACRDSVALNVNVTRERRSVVSIERSRMALHACPCSSHPELTLRPPPRRRRGRAAPLGYPSYQVSSRNSRRAPHS